MSLHKSKAIHLGILHACVTNPTTPARSIIIQDGKNKVIVIRPGGDSFRYGHDLARKSASYLKGGRRWHGKTKGAHTTKRPSPIRNSSSLVLLQLRKTRPRMITLAFNPIFPSSYFISHPDTTLVSLNMEGKTHSSIASRSNLFTISRASLTAARA